MVDIPLTGNHFIVIPQREMAGNECIIRGGAKDAIVR